MYGFKMPEPPPSYSTYSRGPSVPSNPTTSSVAAEMDADMQNLITNLQSLLQSSPTDELQVLCDDDTKLNSLIEDSEKMKQLKKKRSDLMQQNKDQAVLNLSLEPDFELNKAQLGELMVMQNSALEKLNKAKEELGSLSGQLSADTTVALLQAATAEKESASDAIAQKFLDKEISIDDFMSTFTAERTVYHLRKIKVDKMAEVVRNRQYQQQGATPYSSAYGRY